MSVIAFIPTLNAENTIQQLLEGIKCQSLPIRSVMIDSESDDQTLCIAHQFGCTVNVIARSDFNHANTRNTALGYDAEYYLFMTQDAIPYDEHLIANLMQAFDDPDVVIAYARQLPNSDADPIERFARETNYPIHSCTKSKNDLSTLGIKTFFCSDSCAMYRGSYFKSVGGFSPDLNTNEDMEFAARAIMNGKKVAYCAEAKVIHSHRFSVIDIWKRYREIGAFFANHQWILDTVAFHTKTETTGMKQAIAELRHLAFKAPYLLPRSVLISILKFIAFKYGKSLYTQGNK
jgi:rhamnosyltransferase